jgi:hypothetical protein
VIENHPSIKEQVIDLFALCVSEIEEGGSESHEVELCLSDIDELIEGESTV